MKVGIAGRVASAFIDSKLTPLIMIAALLIGTFATMLTPREEEPQIVVPMIDLMVPYPGASASEVEERIARPLEKVIAEIQGVEYIYSTSMPDFALVTVRYFVGENTEESLVKLWSVLMKNMDKMPGQNVFPLIKNKAIDDVSILTLTLWSEDYDGYMLRRISAQLAEELKKVDDVADIELTGGLKRKVRVILDQARMQAFNVDPLQIAQQIQAANQNLTLGSFQKLNRNFLVETGEFLQKREDVENLVVSVFGNNPVYLKDVAEVVDGPEEVKDYVFFGMGVAGVKKNKSANGAAQREFPAVTISVAKRKGADAMDVAEQVLAKVAALKGVLIPGDIHISETRNYGKTASEKVKTLLEHLFGAVLAVTIVVGIFLGWRGGLVVFASVPITFALTLFVYYLFGYTLNRVTLFALIFVTGIVVDDSIIIAENMHRHFSMRKLPPLQTAIAAINEVGNPTILATFTVIASVLPMAFVSGLMGPYMSPMPIGASMAMLFSLLVALIITPWLSYRLLKSDGPAEDDENIMENSRVYKVYQKLFSPLLNNDKKATMVVGVGALLLLVAMLFLPLKLVEVKMLPFDNKSEFQVIIDMPEGTTLEQTALVAKEIANYLRTEPEVENYQYYVGTNAPINFNGLVRHYYLRRRKNMADIQVNLVDKSERADQSHPIAKRVRPKVQEIASRYNARVKIAEVPPGPPVLSTIVAEIYGPDYEQQIAFAQKVRDIFDNTEGVVDVDWLVEDDQEKYTLVVDKEKAALTGVNSQQIAHTMRMALNGEDVGLLHDAAELEPVSIELRLGRENRSSISRLGNVAVRSQTGQMIPVSDLVSIEKKIEDKSIYRKNMKRVVYVTADVAGKIESPIYALLNLDEKIEALDAPGGVQVSPIYAGEPFLQEKIALKWDGEWQITYEVFRDLGAAFGVVLIIIYLLIVAWFQSFKVPLVMMVAIPLSLVGIIPGHFLHGAFFTATSMIGMIALAGIMVRNSVLIIDFIELRLDEGIALKSAVLESAAVRTRPILLTAGTVVIGAIVILFDPIFQGLAIALMWGAIASTGLTLGLVPLIYYLVERTNYPETEIDHK